MRTLLAALTVALVALLATPSAYAGSMNQSLLPRTPRGPAGMQRCVEAPISLAFDVVAREAARFADPRSLTSHEVRETRPLRTPATQGAIVRLGQARVLAMNPRTVHVRVTFKPCSLAPVQAEHGNASAPQSTPEPSHVSSFVSDPAMLNGPSFELASAEQIHWLNAIIRSFGNTAIQAGPSASHVLNPWRPPAA